MDGQRAPIMEQWTLRLKRLFAQTFKLQSSTLHAAKLPPGTFQVLCQHQLEQCGHDSPFQHQIVICHPQLHKKVETVETSGHMLKHVKGCRLVTRQSLKLSFRSTHTSQAPCCETARNLRTFPQYLRYTRWK